MLITDIYVITKENYWKLIDEAFGRTSRRLKNLHWIICNQPTLLIVYLSLDGKTERVFRKNTIWNAGHTSYAKPKETDAY